jgi:hypothetical protein
MKSVITLDFGELKLETELFDSVIANKFVEHLPYTIDLTQWGQELYGSIGIDLGEDKPISDIPPGGLAYTRQGNYFCIFFGQAPAWPVEYIGQIRGDTWKQLFQANNLTKVSVRD